MRAKFYTDDDVLVADVKILPEAMRGSYGQAGVWAALRSEIARALRVDEEKQEPPKGKETHDETDH
jgi:hypothetical protein